MRDKVTRQCPQITTFEEKGEPKRIRTEVPPLTSLYALPLGQTGSLGGVSVQVVINGLATVGRAPRAPCVCVYTCVCV